MRRMLDPTKVGGLPSTIQFDEAGNRTASKDVKVDGKLKLKSLISESNPDGDITKELGGRGGKTYFHSISIASSDYFLYVNIYSNSNTQLTIRTFEELVGYYGNVICTGYYKTSTMYGIPNYIRYDSEYKAFHLYYFDPETKYQKYTGLSYNAAFSDKVTEIA